MGKRRAAWQDSCRRLLSSMLWCVYRDVIRIHIPVPRVIVLRTEMHLDCTYGVLL